MLGPCVLFAGLTPHPLCTWQLEEIEDQPSKEHGLTPDEMDALTRLASDSAVQQERERLEQLLQLQQLVEAEERQAVVARQGEDAAQDRCGIRLAEGPLPGPPSSVLTPAVRTEAPAS